ncbi:PQQ-dependent sugar dehydrogenase [Parasphingopyxis marina]|uniref:PQQ-dependent sugar dehydrogenase n=1 Tax=Parasphingopyxis marina TaxID=2761622 RepID=A0A842I0V4_9SPHN|nr:PQQ-dependent sugar dehydrogenase [Parasphingopyxis marina]MBC2778487.1 PQQ-dependent sugar dehydrogenase [Parasphingopyxis marina]
MLRLISSAALFSLAACGGDGSPTPSPPSPANGAPTITSSGTAQIAENQQIVAQIQASDPDGDTLSYTVSGGTDQNLFSVNANGQLRFIAPPNFDLPTDANLDNVYRVTVRVSDGQASTTLDFTVTVTNDREGIAVRRIATGFVQPTYLANIPGQTELFVIEKSGRLFRFNPLTGQRNLIRTLNNVSDTGEGGLLGVAVPPDYVPNGGGINGFMYVFVTDSNGDISIRRFRENSPEVPQGTGGIMTIPHPTFSNHYGGWIGFDENGLFYIATGDGGGSGDPNGNAQNPNSRLGKILRVGINPDPFAGATVQYFLIPSGNPYASGGGAREVFALGLRNPFRASFAGGDLLIGDVGQNSFEEVDRLSTINGGGTNFGWPFREGSSLFSGTPPSGLTGPVTEYPRGNGARQGASVIGGVVYDGPIAELFAQYIFADFISGNIWSVPIGALDDGTSLPASNYERRNEDFEPDAGSIDQIVAIVSSAAGDIFIVDFDGDIFIVEPA